MRTLPVMNMALARLIFYTILMIRSLIALALLAGFLVPSSVLAAPEERFEVSGWIPYWASSDGTRSARENMESLSAVMPFTYSVSSTGALKDLGGMKKTVWKRLVREAGEADVRVTPTVMWSDGASIHAVLSDPRKRANHIEAIVEMVERGGYDGVDIDYEGKLAATMPYFSAFLDELEEELDGAFLSCTVEARTPPDSLYASVPAVINYANDFKALNRSCDRVNLMTYDQQRADLKLNSARKGAPYYPNADPDWVRKVVTLAAKDIAKDKLVIGIPTYGRELELTVAPEWYQAYTQLWSVNPEYAEDTAKKMRVKPSENGAGEKSYTYLPKKSPYKLSSWPKAPSGTSSGNEVAARALAHANKTGETVKVNLVWWSDADAVEEKIDLARELGVRGVALFKIDGGEDEDIWDLF